VLIQDTFEQKSSIVKRLRTVMLSIIIFILLCFLAIYISNYNQLQDIQSLSTANNLLSLNTQAIESLNSTEQNMNIIFVRNNVSELRYKFEENLKVTKRLLFDSVLQSKDDQTLTNYLNSAIHALDELEIGHEVIFKKLKNIHHITNQEQIEDLNVDLLVANQYLMDGKEFLRKIQIHINKQNEGIFTSIYKNRYRPLLIAIGLCILFLTFVITIGLAMARNATKSILNLLSATEKISKGDIDYQAPILEQDEIGRVTFAFNRMVTTLHANQELLNLAMDRTNRLQSITESFSEALTPDQVFEVVFKQAFEVMEAATGSIVLLSEDKNHLELKRLAGFSEDIFKKWQRFPLSTDVPIAEAIRSGTPMFLMSTDLTKYTQLEKRKPEDKNYAIAYLPLIIEGKSLGALSFSFPTSKNFDQPQRGFMIALARQCAQAIHRSQLFDDAKKAIEVRDEFLSIASHELRTPLTPLKMQIQSIARQINNDPGSTLTPERLIRMVETSDRQISRLSILIDDLLDVTRISSGKLSLNKEFFSMKEMIIDVVSQYAHQFKYSQSVVEVDIEDDMVGFWDKVRIEQVIINLLTNAAKYAPKQAILAKITTHGDMVKVQVTDKGPGITKENHERIFKRFERVSDKQNIGGLGLGLYICKQIVEAHHGKIYVESIPGSGATFTVELPKE
jgi:signal transduction histidine kinase/HAMP domain-containing protein